MNTEKIFKCIGRTKKIVIDLYIVVFLVVFSGKTLSAVLDSDFDGMPDKWEVTYSLNPQEVDDRFDPDGDGWVNIQEYSAGSDPTDFNSTPSVTTNTSAYTIAGTSLTKINLNSGGVSTVGNLYVPGDFEALAFSPTGELYALEDSSYYLYKVNQNTGAATLIGDTGISSAANPGITFDDTGRLWLVGGNGVANLYELNPVTAQASFVGQIGNWNGWSVAHHNGLLYMVDSNARNLYSINKDTAEPSLIGSTGLSIGAQHGMSSDGLNIWFYSESGQTLYSLDRLTGVAIEMVDTSIGGSVECLAIANIEDSDGDGMSDAFEDTYGFNKNYYDDGLLDSDDDGLLNMQEYYSNSDPTEQDTDGDGLGDKAEYIIYRTFPNNADSDSDEMPDGWEVKNNLDPLFDDANLDSDGDGVSNLDEYIAGTLPNSSNGLEDWFEGDNRTVEAVSSRGGGAHSYIYFMVLFIFTFYRRSLEKQTS